MEDSYFYVIVLIVKQSKIYFHAIHITL